MDRGERMRIWGADVSAARVAVLAVHGRGQAPSFMEAESARFGTIPARYFSPAAPGMSWYPRPFMDPIEMNRPALDEALAAISDGLAAIAAAGFDQRETVVWGFSQGACLLTQYLLDNPTNLAGAALMTGGYLGSTTRIEEVSDRLSGVMVVLRGPSHDPWVPAARMTATAELLTQCGADVDFAMEPGDEHIITESAVASVTHLLHEISRS